MKKSVIRGWRRNRSAASAQGRVRDRQGWSPSRQIGFSFAQIALNVFALLFFSNQAGCSLRAWNSDRTGNGAGGRTDRARNSFSQGRASFSDRELFGNKFDVCLLDCCAGGNSLRADRDAKY